MELLAHQVEIIDAIKNNFITSVSAPRQNGKTQAALEAAFELGGRVLFCTRGNALARDGLLRAAQDRRAEKVVNSNGREKVTHAGGVIYFLAYAKTGARGFLVDTLILDEADSIGADIIAEYYPAIFSSTHPRIVGLSVAPDTGLAKHLHDRADRILRWSGRDEASANPALNSLIRPEQLEKAKQVLSPEVYARECLGMTDAEFAVRDKTIVSELIRAQLNGQVAE